MYVTRIQGAAQEPSDHPFRFFILISEMKRPQDAMKVFHHCIVGYWCSKKNIAGGVVLTRIRDHLLHRVLHRQLCIHR